jgi:hypothetical protein
VGFLMQRPYSQVKKARFPCLHGSSMSCLPERAAKDIEDVGMTITKPIPALG